ncbi:hypothetical protein GSY63_20890 [Mucilaginibacter sp. R11]|uniref:Uncharacterized protein n=1 Tax=Mucilaginibacter agri TaxID=2695265 RepID=A0A965ZKS0_9SPHI|nr:hypothetical protein [Mucilaginibacter agri]
MHFYNKLCLIMGYYSKEGIYRNTNCHHFNLGVLSFAINSLLKNLSRWRKVSVEDSSLRSE